MDNFGCTFHNRDVLRTESSAKEVTEDAEHNGETAAYERSPKNPKSPKTIKTDPKMVMQISEHLENVVPSRESIIQLEEELAKIPRKQDLEFLDPVSLYECKIQAILLLRKNLSHYTTKWTKYKLGEDSQDDTFLEIDAHLLAGVLRER